MLKIGILNLQGAVSEHYNITKEAIEKLGINAQINSIRFSDEVSHCDGIIISGGESTVIGKIIKKRGIDKVIKENKIPVFGTCAGMILLSKKTDFNQDLLNIMDITIKRNAFGRQKDSFESKISFLGRDFNGVFIRAPAIEEYDKSKRNIKVLSTLNEKIIAIKQGNNLAVAFHPELTKDIYIHEYFLKGVM